MSPRAPESRKNLRSLFLSDLHLGARASHPRAVLDFLAAHEAETIYLVGDVLDLWHGGEIHWTPVHDAVMSELDRRARAGVRVIYLAGNHDAVMRYSEKAQLPEAWELREAITHTSADGRSYLVLHGDQCDARLFRLHFMTRVGSRADAMFRGLDAWLTDRYGRWAGLGEYNPIQVGIRAFNSLFVMGGRFERRLVALAQAAGMDGVVCGHSHRPALREVNGAVYANCGDWVDSFTALVEDESGALRLIDWAADPAARPVPGWGEWGDWGEAEPAETPEAAEAPSFARGRA